MARALYKRAAMPWLVLARLAMLAALAASAALYVQYIDPVEATFCGPDSGCDVVRRSGLGYFGSPYVSLPLVGLIAYAVVFAVSLHRELRRTLLVWLAGAGGAVGVVLFGLQAFQIGALCWLCVVVDCAALAVAVLCVLAQRRDEAAEGLRRWAWYGLATLAVAGPIVFNAVKPAPPVPPVIRELYEPGKVNVVEFADFQCPFCRRYHEVLKSVLGEFPDTPIHLVRLNVPLPQHTQALPAARAYLCAKAQGKGEAMADRLFTMELSRPAMRRTAVELGLDMTAYDTCIRSEQVDRKIREDTSRLEAAGMQGLPTTYIGAKRFVGLVSEAALRDAIEQAQSGQGETGVPGPIYAALLFVLVAAIAWFGRERRGNLQHAQGSGSGAMD